VVKTSLQPGHERDWISTKEGTMEEPAPRNTGAATPKESYTLQDQSHRQFIEQRRASVQASFLIPHLRPGMRLLDCGCGAGAITVGLAEIVAPGEVVGVDQDTQQIELARQRAADQGISNLTFESANVYTLPFPDASFDAVYSNAVFEHLADPAAALREFKRVVKVGGVVGVRCSAGGDITAPADPLLERGFDYVKRLYQHNGGDISCGSRLRPLFHEAGLSRIEAGASYECYATLEKTRQWANMVARVYEGRVGQQMIEIGLTNKEELAEIVDASTRWGEDPGAFLGRSWGHAVGWRE
jgi:ubiquinone/menaquinone biosynthesis C-methylase UbiE